MNCEANGATPANLMTLQRLYQPGITVTQVLPLDLEIDSSMELYLVWIISTSLLLVWNQRQDGSVSDARSRAELLTRCKVLKQSNNKNAFTLTSLTIRTMIN